MKIGKVKGDPISRRAFLRAAGATAGVAITSTAGCLDLWGLTPSGGAAGFGGGPTFQDITVEDADVIVESTGELVSAVGQSSGTGAVIWIPDGTTIDLTGRNIELTNVTLASARSEESQGAVIVTSDRGQGSPIRSDALITLHEGARLSGVVVRGPLHNYTTSQVIPGYVPFAPGETWAIREQWRDDWYCRGISVQHDSAQVDNCEIWGWSTGIMVGAKEQSVSANILYCFIHNCMMTSAGYPIDVKRGTPLIYRCAFNAYRHALNGYGYADAGYRAIECDFGPLCSSHPIDMHGIHNNARDGGSSDPNDLRYRWRAGGTMLVRNCRVMPTTTIDDSLHTEGAGYINHNAASTTPHVHIRAAPADGFYFEGNLCSHSDLSVAVHQSSVPPRLPRNTRGWHKIFVQSNQWGVDFSGGESAQA